jgi:hypothetical protein
MLLVQELFPPKYQYILSSRLQLLALPQDELPVISFQSSQMLDKALNVKQRLSNFTEKPG